MKKGKLKKLLAGIGIVGLVASVGISLNSCKKADDSGEKKTMEKPAEGGSSCGKGSCGGTGSCGGGEQK